ncbi:MAG: GIY-YIG nuclease family protein [Microbacteriaceae bacterium]
MGPWSHGVETPVHVYFLHAEAKRRVKIGVARDISKRQRQLEREHGPLALVHHFRCDSSPESFMLEKGLHYHFRRQHLALEWFSESVLEGIEQLDPAKVVKEYRATRIYEIRLARADVEALEQRGLSVEDAVQMALAKNLLV